MKTLYVKRTTNYQLSKEWSINSTLKGELYIQCTINGSINFQTNSIYSLDQLLKRGSVKIIY